MLADAKVAPRVIERLRTTYDVVLFPTRPAIIDGEPRWAWLTVNPSDYRVASVLDTGEHGAMLEHVLDNLLSDALSFIVGGFKGVEESVWTVAAFSLELDDEDEILEAAHKFAKGLASGFGVSSNDGPNAVGVDVGGMPAATLGPVKFELIPGKGVMPNQNLLGFTNGFKAGVDYYFSRAGGD